MIGSMPTNSPGWDEWIHSRCTRSSIAVEVRQDLVLLRARDALVAVRTELINTTRGLVKSMGTRLPKCSSRSFGHKAGEAIPGPLREALQPLGQLAEGLNACIAGYDRRIEELASKKYGHTKMLRQVSGSDHGAGRCVDLGKSRTILQESGGRTLSGISAEARGLRGEPATIGNQQSRGHDAAQA